MESFLKALPWCPRENSRMKNQARPTERPHRENMFRTPAAAAAVAGLAGTIGQIVVLRELLVLFHGYELSTGLIFSCWLLWTAAGSGLAGRLPRRWSHASSALPTSLLLQAILLPLTLLIIRASRIIWSIPPGVLVSPGIMLGITASSMCFFCLVSGFVFALAWSTRASELRQDGKRAISVYLGEAAGAALGGILFYFVLLPWVRPFASTLIVSGIVIAYLISSPAAWRIRSFRQAVLPAAMVASVGLLGIAGYSSDPVDTASRRWRWGGNLLAVRDTPFHNLALLRAEKQYSVFANGLWLFTIPDPQTAEHAVHMALLQHPEPRRVLLIGGGASGFIPEILKHPTLTETDCVEPDPGIIQLARDYLPESATEPLDDPRVRFIHTDAGSFVRRAASRYDVILCSLGDPVNAEMNRFYTLEFFERIKKLLNPGAVFSFSISSSPDILGPAQTRLIQSLHRTARRAFPAVLVIPGESARFLASDGTTPFIEDPAHLAQRIVARQLDLHYVREYYLFDQLSPFRLEYMKAVLDEDRSAAVNRDFEPACYFNNMVIWAIQLNPGLGRTLEWLADGGKYMVHIGLAAAVFAASAVLLAARRRSAAAVNFNVMLTGGVHMTLVIVLLLAFQILEGFIYTQLALIIASFMTGIALGAAFLSAISRTISNPFRGLAAIQAGLALYLAAIACVLSKLQHCLDTPGCPASLPAWLFPALALAGGMLAGVHFAAAAGAVRSTTVDQGRIGGSLYAWDLVGAAAGALAATIVLLPLHGILTTLWVQVALTLAGIIPLAGRAATGWKQG